jgi:hypothetical protein
MLVIGGCGNVVAGQGPAEFGQSVGVLVEDQALGLFESLGLALAPEPGGHERDQSAVGRAPGPGPGHVPDP